jgi:predicted DNA-binding transcriptional regulator AlpA
MVAIRDELLPIAEVAALLGVDVRTIHRLRHQGFPAPISVSKRMKRWSRRSLQDWIDRGGRRQDDGDTEVRSAS